jgi:urocanate hydratase
MSCMATTTHTMVVELSHEVVVSFMRWLFCEATNPFSIVALSSTSSKILCGTAWDELWDY